MVQTFISEEKYPYSWNDNIIVAVYENEICKNNDQALLFNSNGSKRQLLRKLASLSQFPVEAMLILENMMHLTNIEAFRQTQRIVLSTEYKTITTHASKGVLDILMSLK